MYCPEPQGATMRRRDFIKAIAGSAATWPLAVRAQQRAVPVIGFLNGASPDEYAPFVAAFRQGLKEGGTIEGQTRQLSITGRKVDTTDCRRWQPTWSIVMSRLLRRPVRPQRRRPRQRRRQFPLYLRPGTILSGWASLPV